MTEAAEDQYLPQTGLAAKLNWLRAGVLGAGDGIVSTAFGVASRHPGPTVCVLGDIAFFHECRARFAHRGIELLDWKTPGVTGTPSSRYTSSAGPGAPMSTGGPLARAAYRSITGRLLPLPDDLPVYPTHGGGSFCSAAAGGERTTTIGHERATNPLLLGDPDEDAFVERLLTGLGSYPPYFLELRDVNRHAQ